MSTTPTTTAGTRVRDLGLAVAWLSFLLGTVVVFARAAAVVEVLLGLVPNALLIAGGTIILLRSDADRIGWLLVVPGALFNWSYVAEQALEEGESLGLLLVQSIGPLAVLPLMLLLLVFPTGRYPDAVSRALGRFVTVLLVGMSVVLVVDSLLDSPIGHDLIFQTGILALGLVALAALANQARLYGDRPRIEQQQLKWFLLAIAGILLYPVVVLLELPDVWFRVVDGIVTSLWPISIFVAISRYRLYDVDRIISRTVAYAAVTGALALLFVGGVATITTLLPAQDRFAVAVTTVAVVALFNPLRGRVVALVDRRFDRHRYRAQQVVEEFGRSIQVETDLDAVRGRLHDVIGHTTAPTTVAVWEPARLVEGHR